MAKTKQKEKAKRFRRTDTYHIPIDKIQEIKGSIEFNGEIYKENARTDYGDLNELSKNIEENGILEDTKGFKVGDVYYLTDGHRRYRAGLLVMKRTGEVIEVPMKVQRYVKESERVLDMINCNTGLPLKPLEHANALMRLKESGLTDAEIRQKTQWSGVYISNLKLLLQAPPEIHNMINENVVAATLAMDVLRKSKDFQDAVETLHNATEMKVETTGEAKITKKDIVKSKNKINSMSALRKAFKHHEKGERNVRMDNIELFEFVVRLMDGSITYEEICTKLYEPPDDENKNQSKIKFEEELG